MKLLTAACLLLVPTTLQAQDDWESIQPYLTDDVAGVAYLDLTQIDTIGMLEFADKLGFGPDQQQRQQTINTMLNIQQRLDEADDFGARYVYALFRATDLRHRGPTWVLPIAEGGNPTAVLGMVLSGRPNNFEIQRDMRPPFLPDHCEVQGSFVLGANSAVQLAMLKSKRTKQRRDLSAAWKTLGQGSCGLMVFGDQNQDSRRVIRELFPQLPAPFQEIDGPFIADRLQWGGFVVDLPCLLYTSDAADE